MVIGHEAQREELRQAIEADVDRVIMLRGLPGIGKWAVAGEAIEPCGGPSVQVRDGSADSPKDLVRLTERKPVGSQRVFAIVDIDSMSYRDHTVLLKTLEETPPWLTVILTASVDVPATVLSRVQRLIHFAPLSIEQVRGGLEEQGFPEWQAEELAKMSSGSIGKALMLAGLDKVKPDVLALIDAMSRRDLKALADVESVWGIEHGQMFSRWYLESTIYALTGYLDPRMVFTLDEVQLLNKVGAKDAWQMVNYLREGYGPQAAARTVWRR